MLAALLLPILLRIAGPLAFLSATAAAGVMNRSIMVVPILAAVATLTTILIRKFTPSPAVELKAILSPEANPQPDNPFRGMGRGFAMGLVGYTIVFALAAWIAALFQTTEFEPQVRWDDAALALIPALIALIGAWLSARLGLNQMASMMGQMQTAFSQMQSGDPAAESSEEAFTFEGEIIDPEDPRES